MVQLIGIIFVVFFIGIILRLLINRFKNRKVSSKKVDFTAGVPLSKMLDKLDDGVDAVANALHEYNENHDYSEENRKHEERRKLDEERNKLEKDRIELEEERLKLTEENRYMEHNSDRKKLVKSVCSKCGGGRVCGVCYGAGQVEWGTRASGMPLITRGAPGSSRYKSCVHCGGTGICPESRNG